METQKSKWEVEMLEDCDNRAISNAIALFLNQGWSLYQWRTTYVGRDEGGEPWVIHTALLTRCVE